MTKTILVVDDDTSIRRLLEVNLMAEGYGVVTAVNGAEALSKLAEGGIDLVVLDVMMPLKDGWEVCKAIRDNEDDCRQKIIMLTARDTPRDKMIGTDLLGADEYITKPFDVDELMELIARMS
ncbi:MAG: response regulator transcription factor [Chitinispirillaceae bacterium]